MKKFSHKFTKEEKASWALFICAWFVYAIISMAKNTYSSAIASITAEGFFGKSAAGIINGGFYLFYGGAQLLGMKFLDKISPAKMITASLAGVIVSCVGMIFAKSFVSMLLLWSFCGLVQFSVWPAILRIIAEYVLPEHQNRAKVYISFSYCAGMFLTYFMASVILKYARWRMLFAATAVIVGIFAILWVVAVKNTEPVLKRCERKAEKKENKQTQSMGFMKMMLFSGLVLLLIPNFARSCLDLGVKSWVPTMITELYGVSASAASVLTTVVVFINLAGIFIAGWMYPRFTKNLAWAYGLTFVVSLPITALLLLTGKINVVLVVIFLAVITTMMYAGHQFINVLIPSYFAKYNRAGAAAAFLNAIASFGIVISNIGYGYLAENYGWSATIWSWVIIAAVGIIFCALAAPLWQKFTEKKE